MAIRRVGAQKHTAGGVSCTELFLHPHSTCPCGRKYATYVGVLLLPSTMIMRTMLAA